MCFFLPMFLTQRTQNVRIIYCNVAKLLHSILISIHSIKNQIMMTPEYVDANTSMVEELKLTLLA